jgi:hypothetical protein
MPLRERIEDMESSLSLQAALPVEPEPMASVSLGVD